MMRKNIGILLLTVLLVLCAYSCSAPEGFRPGEESMCFRLKADIPALAQARSAVSGVEGVWAMQLLCFDHNDLYLGLGSVTVGPDGTMSGTVPTSTASIHFIANAGLVPPDGWKGLAENILVSSLTSSVSNTHIVYWGFHKEDGQEEMAAWLNASPANTVLLLRDRAKITMSEPDHEWDHNISVSVMENIVDVRFAAANGLRYGKIAPFNRSTLSFAYDAPLTLPGDDTRFSGDESELVPGNGEQFVFEDSNDIANPVKVILEIQYRSISGADTTFFVKYHQVLLMKEDWSMYEVRRNHQYNLVIGNLPSSLGYDSFSEALRGTPSNNQTVVVQEIVPRISTGEYDISISRGTTQVFQEPVEGDYAVIGFTYLKSGNADPAIGVDNFSAVWLSNKYVAWPDMEILLREGGEPGSFEILVDLYMPITRDLKSGKILLTDKANGLIRYINIYSITAFDFNAKIEATGDTSNPWRLSFDIPENYPASLLPLTVWMATENFKATSSQNADQALGVVVSDTWEITGTALNYWYTYQANATGTHSILLEPVPGRSGLSEIWLYAPHFGSLDADGNRTADYVYLEAEI